MKGRDSVSRLLIVGLAFILLAPLAFSSASAAEPDIRYIREKGRRLCDVYIDTIFSDNTCVANIKGYNNGPDNIRLFDVE